MSDEPKDSQEEPTQDSGLQTPQPDQPMPKETERRDDLPEDSPPVRVEVETTEPVDVSVDNPSAPSSD